MILFIFRRKSLKKNGAYFTITQLYLFLRLAVVHFDVVKCSHCPSTLRLWTYKQENILVCVHPL